MINYDQLKPSDRNDIRRACAYLFTPREADNPRFIKNLDEKSLRQAFRNKARRYHPDMNRGESNEMLKKRNERFAIIKNSYDILMCHIPEEPKPVPESTGEPVIIAVGGAKGGVGKTMFSANLGVVLSDMGKRVVLADMDLGGSNLHLYLGETRIINSLNEFLERNVVSLNESVVKTRYGPGLIAGDSSRLGSANISFSRKLRLIKAFRQIDADYVILDLGGDTSFNFIDFFNISDIRLVLTSHEPASYLDAYNFIKVSIYRRLVRLFGAEYNSVLPKDHQYEKTAKKLLAETGNSRVKTLRQFSEKIRELHPSVYPTVRRELKRFVPFLIFNRIPDEVSAGNVSRRLRDVSEQMLSVNVETVSRLSSALEIEDSALTLVPVVRSHPRSMFRKKIEAFINDFLL